MAEENNHQAQGPAVQGPPAQVLGAQGQDHQAAGQPDPVVVAQLLRNEAFIEAMRQVQNGMPAQQQLMLGWTKTSEQQPAEGGAASESSR